MHGGTNDTTSYDDVIRWQTMEGIAIFFHHPNREIMVRFKTPKAKRVAKSAKDAGSTANAAVTRSSRAPKNASGSKGGSKRNSPTSGGTVKSESVVVS